MRTPEQFTDDFLDAVGTGAVMRDDLIKLVLAVQANTAADLLRQRTKRIEDRQKGSQERLKNLENLDLVIRLVCKEFDVAKMELISHRRPAHIIPIRYITYHLCRKLTTASWPDIADRLGHRDHSTIIHGAEIGVELLWKHPVLSDTAALIIRAFKESNPE